MNKIKRINFYGGAGSGKSTTATWTFSELKRLGYCVELVTEHVKKWSWENKKPKSFMQIYLFGKQLYSEDVVLSHGCKLIVTDSPVLLSSVYAELYSDNKNISPHLKELALIYEKENPSLNILLERGNKPYNTSGRWGNLDEAKIVDEKILSMLDDNKVTYIKSSWDNREEILNYLTSELNVENYK